MEADDLFASEMEPHERVASHSLRSGNARHHALPSRSEVVRFYEDRFAERAGGKPSSGASSTRKMISFMQIIVLTSRRAHWVW